MDSRLLPQITIQHDYPTVLSEIQQGLHAVEDIWISCYNSQLSVTTGELMNSVHGRVRISEIEGSSELELIAREGVEVEFVSNTELTVSCESIAIPKTRLLFPLQNLYKLSGGIDCFSPSSDQSLIGIGGKRGKLLVLTVQTGREIQLRGFVDDLILVEFFPSNQVVLAASADFTIKIFSVLDGSNPRTFIGHSRPISGASILGIGKKFISTALDGSIRLWNVGQGIELARLNLGVPITCLIRRIEASDVMKVDGEEESLWDEVGVLIVGCSDGKIRIIRKGVEVTTLGDGLLNGRISCIAADDKCIISGSEKGRIQVYDFTSFKLLNSFHRSNARITSLSLENDVLFIGNGEGLPFSYNLQTREIESEFGGINNDSVVVRRQGNGVYIASQDGVLSRYSSQ